MLTARSYLRLPVSLLLAMPLTVISRLPGFTPLASRAFTLPWRPRVTPDGTDATRRHSELIQALTEAVVVFDDDLTVLEANPAAASLFGRPPDQLLGSLRGSSRDADSPLAWATRAQRALRANGGRWRDRIEFADGTGRSRTADVTCVRLHDSLGRSSGFVAVYRDVTEDAEKARRIEVLEEQWRRTFDASPIGLIVVDAEGRTLHANKAFTAFLGYDLGELRTMPSIAPLLDTSGGTDFLARGLLGASADAFQLDRLVVRKSGEHVWASVSVAVLRNPDGSPQRYVAFVEDISHRRAHTERLLTLASQDSLTSLANRGAFLERLAEATADGAPPIALGFMDLDGFKAVNDQYGHQTGDELLRYVADRIRARLRTGDLAARIGGDEFALLVAPGSEDDLAAFAQRIVAAIARPFVLERTTISISASIGIVRFHGAISPQQALRQADEAMYEAKAAGKNRFILK